MEARMSTRVPYFRSNNQVMTFSLANAYISTRDYSWAREARTILHRLVFLILFCMLFLFQQNIYRIDRDQNIFRPWRKPRRPKIERVMDPDFEINLSPLQPLPINNEPVEYYKLDDEINRFKLTPEEKLEHLSPAATSQQRLRVTLSTIEVHKKIQKNLFDKYALLSEEQKNFVKSIRDIIMEMSISLRPSIEYVLLTGHAGCGKTSTLELIPLIGYTKIKYIAITHRLCAAARKNYNVSTQTFCKFLMNLMLTPPFETMDFSDTLSYVKTNFFTADSFTCDIGDFFYDEYHRLARDYEDLPPDAEPIENLNCKDCDRPAKFFRDLALIPTRNYSEHISRIVNVIFLDEISMFTPGQLEFFMMVFEALSAIMNEKFLLILTGDFMQIQPLFATTINYDRVRNLCTHKFNFTAQHRITDKNYLNVVMELTKDPLISNTDFLKRLKSVIPADRYTNDVSYCYPRNTCYEMYKKYCEIGNPYRWIEQLPTNFFEHVLSFTMFSFTNRESHYNNITMALKILTQFNLNNVPQEETDRFIKFTAFHLKKFDLVSPIPISCNYRIPVLPLIRYFPYRVLVHSNPELVSKTIVYLLDWNLQDKTDATVTVYNPDDGQIFTINLGTFNMNMADAALFGIPLELFVSSTMHSSQGLTLSNDVVVSLHNIDRHELFVILTRVRSSDQIKCFYDV